MNLLNTNFEEQKIGVRRLNLNNGHEHLISQPAANLLHDDGKAPSWAFHWNGNLTSQPAADLLHS